MQAINITSTKMLGTRCFKTIKILVQCLVKKMIIFIKLDKMVKKQCWLKKPKKEKIKIKDSPLKIHKLDKCKLKEREN